MDLDNNLKRKTNPKERANILSKLSFFYTRALFVEGYKKAIEKSDLYEVIKTCRSEDLGDQLAKQWEKEAQAHKKPSIICALWKCHWKKLLIVGFLQLFTRIFTTLLQPYALSKLVAYFNPGQTELTKQDSVFYASIVIWLVIINAFINNNISFFVIELGLQVRTAICSLIYRKSLTLNSKSLSNITMGRITTIMTKDIDGFEISIETCNTIWIGLIQTIVICYLIYEKIGVSSVSGITFFVIILPFQVFLGLLAYKYRLQNSYKTDARIELIQEVLSAIKIIKMYTWEKYFEKEISKTRKAELKLLHRFFYSKVAILIIGSVTSRIAFFLFIMTHIYMEEAVTAEVIYYILGLFTQLEIALVSTIPFSLSHCAEVLAVSKRMETVLHEKSIPPVEKLEETCENPRIDVDNVTTLLSGTVILKNISLKIDTRGLYVVLGSTASGKSTFFKTLLRECDFKGKVNITGKISYASQEAWLFPSTIRNNILFGENFDKSRYQQIINICNLEYDLNLLDNGDSTIVGDRGINLSKGQQARINLARAIYRNADIYLLDDSLAALDGHVSDSIFSKCIKTYLKEKTCIFVTNNWKYVQEAYRIILINNCQLGYSDSIDKNQLAPTENFTEHCDVALEDNDVKKQIYNEEKKSGGVAWSDYYNYVIYGGGVIMFSFLISLFLISQSASSYSEKLLSNWVTLEQNVSNSKLQNKTGTAEYEEIYTERTKSLNLYIGVIVTTTILSIIRSIAFFNFIKLGCIKMHKSIVHSILNSKMSFFDDNLIGNVLNRFSRDYLVVDEYFPFSLGECFMMIFVVCGGIILLTSVNVIHLVESLCLLFVAAVFKHIYQPTGRNLQRLNSTTRSPMIGHVNSTLEGLSIIRAHNAQNILTAEYDKHQNLYTSANYSLICSNFALAIAIELSSALFISSVILPFVLTDVEINVGDVGLVITQSFAIADIISRGVRSLTYVENQMTSVERILEYINIDQETNSEKTLDKWPNLGLIEFKNVSLYYNNLNKPLSNVSFAVYPNERLGIVGRTGAGKSSIISCLFRLYSTTGMITIDGIDIQTLPLNQLRSNISVIPQDPYLFSGTVRDNLDPFQQYTDEDIWNVLQKLQLNNAIGNLSKILDKGTNISTGQKQLLCLARAILRKTKIVVLDEATANVDQETDALIRATVQSNFQNCTMIIVSHRLPSVLNCDKVAVMSQGCVTEFDAPEKLLENKSSFLHYVIK